MSSLRKTYRFYGYDAAHEVVTSDWIDAPSDEDAIDRAAALGFTKCELWDGHRMVAQLDREHRAA